MLVGITWLHLAKYLDASLILILLDLILGVGHMDRPMPNEPCTPCYAFAQNRSQLSWLPWHPLQKSNGSPPGLQHNAGELPPTLQSTVGKVTPFFSPIVNAARKFKNIQKLSSHMCKTPWERKPPQWEMMNKTIYYFDIKTQCKRMIHACLGKFLCWYKTHLF